jgi:hypothetical protein
MAPRFPGYDEALHQAVSALFLGPCAENFSYLIKTLNTVLTEQFKARQGYFPYDPKFINETVQDSDAFKGGGLLQESLRVTLMVFKIAQIHKLDAGVLSLARELSTHYVPSWNPCYNGHMLNDMTLPGIFGYLTAMLCKPCLVH